MPFGPVGATCADALNERCNEFGERRRGEQREKRRREMRIQTHLEVATDPRALVLVVIGDRM